MDPTMDHNPEFDDEELSHTDPHFRVVNDSKDDIVIVDDPVPPLTHVAQDRVDCCKGKRYWLWLLLVFGAGCIALGVVLSRPQDTPKEVVYDRNGYYLRLQQEFLPLVNSPQDQAIEWMAFRDIPLGNAERGRIKQRYALVVWYFAHGGPTTWSYINDSQLPCSIDQNLHARGF